MTLTSFLWVEVKREGYHPCEIMDIHGKESKELLKVIRVLVEPNKIN